MNNANSRQVGGQHYARGEKFQHWDFAIQCLNNRYLEGNITKYVTRHRFKNGLQDLEKARHYTEKLQEEFVAGRVQPPQPTQEQMVRVAEFCEANKLNPHEQFIITMATSWQRSHNLSSIIYNINVLETSMKTQMQLSDAIKVGLLPPGATVADLGEPQGNGYVDQDR